MTESMGLLPYAMESFVNLAGAAFALWMIRNAKSALDKDHPLDISIQNTSPVALRVF